MTKFIKTPRSTWTTTLKVILGIFLWFTLFLSILLVAFPLALLHWTHNLISRIFRRDLIPVTNVLDHLLMFKPTSENPLMNCGQIWKLQGKLDLQEFRNHFQKLFLSTPELRESYRNLYCYLEQWGLYVFKKPVERESLNLEEMIQEMHWDYRNQEKDTEDEEALEGFIGKWMSTLNYGKSPCWRILLVHFDKTGESVLLFKCAHATADGYTFVHMIDKLCGVQTPYIVKDFDFTFVTKMRYILTFPATVFVDLLLRDFLQKPIPLPDHTPLVKSLEDCKWLISLTSLDLEKVKKIRKLTNTHFNTVLATIKIGALRKYSLETNKVEDLPENAFLPWTTGWPKHPAILNGIMTNHFSITGSFVPFRNEDPLHRLLKAEDELLTDLGFEVVLIWILLKVTWAFPPSLALPFLRMLAGLKLFSGTLCLCPVMYSNEKYELMGIPVNHLYFSVNIPAFARACQLYLHPLSSAGKIDLSVTATNKIFKDQKDLERFTKLYLAEELDSLLKAVTDNSITKM